MTSPTNDARLRSRQAREVVLNYLEESSVPWPGGDGLTLNDVLSGYARAAASGLVPGPMALRSCHPELADELSALFGR
jgi:hypothetical protein